MSDKRAEAFDAYVERNWTGNPHDGFDLDDFNAGWDAAIEAAAMKAEEWEHDDTDCETCEDIREIAAAIRSDLRGNDD